MTHELWEVASVWPRVVSPARSWDIGGRDPGTWAWPEPTIDILGLKMRSLENIFIIKLFFYQAEELFLNDTSTKGQLGRQKNDSSNKKEMQGKKWYVRGKNDAEGRGKFFNQI